MYKYKYKKLPFPQQKQTLDRDTINSLIYTLLFYYIQNIRDIINDDILYI
jgi:hypothetical protein